MWIRKIFLSLPILALPTIGATLGDSGVEVGIEVNQKNHEVVEVVERVDTDTIKKTSWTSFLSPHYILEGIQNAYLPPALRVTSVVRTWMEPRQSPSDFWELAKESKQKVEEYVHRLLAAGATYFKSAKFTDITSAMNHIVSSTAAFRDNIKDALDAHHVTFDALTEELESIFMAIVNDLEKIPPPDKAPGHAERKELTDKILDDTEQALIKLAKRYGIKEEVVTDYLFALKPQLEALIVAVGDINEQHPQLLPALAFSVAVLLIPESWILRPFLSVFGFGPAGPVKGSAAAWMQRLFWGAAVRTGSWFSWLQAAGMGIFPKWAGLVVKAPLLIGGLLAMLLPCLKRG